jgi:hypothetical protein
MGIAVRFEPGSKYVAKFAALREYLAKPNPSGKIVAQILFRLCYRRDGG